MPVEHAQEPAAGAGRRRSTASRTRSSPRPSGSPTTSAARRPAALGSEARSSTCRSRTTVTSKVVGKRIPPVTVDSLVAPTHRVGRGPRHARRQGRRPQRPAGVANIAVDRHAARSRRHATTDQDGCVVCSSVPIGTYTITLNTPGYIDRGRQPTPSHASQTVVAKTVSFATITLRPRRRAPTSTVTTHVPGHDAHGRRRQAVEGARRLRDQRRQRRPAHVPARRAPANAGRGRRSCSRSRRTPTRSSPAPARTRAPQYTPTNTNYFTTTNPAAALLADPPTASCRPRRCASRRSTSASARRTAARRPGQRRDDDQVYAACSSRRLRPRTCVEPSYR